MLSSSLAKLRNFLSSPIICPLRSVTLALSEGVPQTIDRYKEQKVNQRLKAVLARHNVYALTPGSLTVLALRDVASAFDLVRAASRACTTDSSPLL